MRNFRSAIWLFAALLCAMAAVGAAAGQLAGNSNDAVEIIPWMAQRTANAPVDFGIGPGRGRQKPPRISAANLRDKPVHPNRETSSPTGGGGVVSITMNSGGAYTFIPTCAIDAPTAPGVQAQCKVYALGAAIFFPPKQAPGTGYSVNDVVTMSPMPGLTCSNYPAITVLAVDVSGAITSVGRPVIGLCTAIPATGTYSFSGGKGNGFALPVGPYGVRWRVLFTQVTAKGAGYMTAPNVTFQSLPNGTAQATAAISPPAPASSALPAGGSTASSQGMFGNAVAWPINPLHMALLPDGRVLNYGTDQNGTQSGALVYDVWDPSFGTAAGAHMVLPNVTTTDLFCSGTSVLWTTGQVLMTGGDLTVQGVRNYANNKTTIFNPSANAVRSGVSMRYPRWYGTLVPLPDGRKLVIGGYVTRPLPGEMPERAPNPEIFDPYQGWMTLSGIGSLSGADWYYPRAHLAPDGSLFELSSSGQMFNYNLTGLGSVQRLPATVAAGHINLPTVMFAPGKLLSVRLTSVIVVDINGSKPVVTNTAPLDQVRFHASTTLMADGKVLVNGGSTANNQLVGVAYAAQIWDPATGHWTTAANATKPRLYHSNALLLPDATVLTAGGGSPGPIVNLNAEIYYPPYLYAKDGSGQPAPRPTIAGVQIPPNGVQVGGSFGITMGAGTSVTRVTLVRSGAPTHSNDVEQRFLDLTPTMVQAGSQVTVTLPSNPNVVVPGYYMLFAFDANGVPSVASQILIVPDLIYLPLRQSPG